MQQATIRVTRDGKPVDGARVSVSSGIPSRIIDSSITDGSGKTVLPHLPPGAYVLRADSGSFGNSAEICLSPCPDNFLEKHELVVVSLAGQLQSLDDEVFNLPELLLQVHSAPVDAPLNPLNGPEQQTIPDPLPNFHGVVTDPAGGFIPGATINVITPEGQGWRRVITVDSGSKGRFRISLPNGEYVAVVSRSGFRSRSVRFTISSAAAPRELQLLLNLGMVT